MTLTVVDLLFHMVFCMFGVYFGAWLWDWQQQREDDGDAPDED